MSRNPLIWTKDKPTEPGLYLNNPVEHVGRPGNRPMLVSITERLYGKGLFCEVLPLDKVSADFLWLGPLPEPGL